MHRSKSRLSVVRSEIEEQTDNRLVGHSADVAELMVADGDLAQDTSHYLS